MKLTDTVYAMAYQNHRYDGNHYQITYYNSEELRNTMKNTYEEATGGKVILFQFKPSDIIKGQKGGD